MFPVHGKKISRAPRKLRMAPLLLSLIIAGLLLYCLIATISYSRTKRAVKNNAQLYPSLSNEFLSSRLKIDRSPRSHADIVRDAQKAAPTFPISFWEAHKHETLHYKNRSCARFPNVYELHASNLYWQTLTTSDGIFYLFGAYYDTRERCASCPAVRLLAMVNRPRLTVKTYCQIWYADIKEPLIVESREYFCMLNWRMLPANPYLITCSIPPDFHNRSAPICVSLVERMCDIASNSLMVNFNEPDPPAKKKSFAVCVKMMDSLHNDQSARLVEWIELVRLLGADKIIFYTLHVHENMTKVLKYYEERGQVDIIPTTLVGNQVNAVNFQHLFMSSTYWGKLWINDFIQLNDCFYKYMYKYDYITPFDKDEVIMPIQEYNWKGLMNKVLEKASPKDNITSYETYMVIFPDCSNLTRVRADVPPYMYMMQHVLSDRVRSIQHTPKTFFDTEMIEVLNNHWALKCLIGRCKAYHISRQDAELFHYRDQPFNKKKLWSCEELIRNNTVSTTIWKYKEPLINRTLTALYNLGFYDL